MLTLRAYQNLAIDLVRARLKAGILRIILQLPTGAGKTVIAAFMMVGAIGKGMRVLVVAHRVELINQMVSKLILAGVPEASIGVIRSGDPRARPGAPIQVASVLSMRKTPMADLVIIDEAHRSSAASYKRIFEDLPNAIVIGLTATPERLDGRPLDMYQEIVVAAQPGELATAGYIMAPIVYSVPLEALPDLTGVRSVAGDYNRSQLATIVRKSVLIGSIVDHWLERAERRLTIVSAVTVAHAMDICKEFVARGIPAEHIDGNTKEQERKDILDRLRAGITLVVTQVDVWTEGVDIPEVKCIVLARPTESLTVYLQIVGRALRPGGIPLILDHAGNVRFHGMPMEPRLYSLEGRRKRAKDNSLAKTCKRCFAMFPADAPACTVCGFEPSPEDREPGGRCVRTEDGFLVEVMQDEGSLRQQFWQRLAHEAVSVGFKRGWAAHKFKDRYGEWPPESWDLPEKKEKKSAPDTVRRKELNKLRAIGHKSGKDQEWALSRYKEMFGEEARDLMVREAQARKTVAKPEQVNDELDVGI